MQKRSPIFHSVGVSGANIPTDVAMVQRLLNARGSTSGSPLAVDGRIGPATIAAIQSVQRRFVRVRVDGRIDPNGATIHFLASPHLHSNATAGQEHHASHASSISGRHVAHSVAPLTSTPVQVPTVSPNVPLKVMTSSQQGIDFIKGFEKLRLKVYDANPPHKDMTIGWGHKLKKGETYSEITNAQADKLFEEDLAFMESHVNGDLRVQVTQDEFNALVSLRFNAGPFAVTPPVSDLNRNGHATVDDFNKHYITAGGEFKQGLLNRRTAEWNIFSKGVYDTRN